MTKQAQIITEYFHEVFADRENTLSLFDIVFALHTIMKLQNTSAELTEEEIYSVVGLKEVSEEVVEAFKELDVTDEFEIVKALCGVQAMLDSANANLKLYSAMHMEMVRVNPDMDKASHKEAIADIAIKHLSLEV